jgi:DNA-binding helix-turn-helix protein
MHNVHKNKGEETMVNNSKLEFDFNNVTAELEKKNIKELRESIGMSRQEFCTVFNVPYRTLQSWEHGTRDMSAFTKRLLVYFILTEKNKQNSTVLNKEGEKDGEENK